MGNKDEKTGEVARETEPVAKFVLFPDRFDFVSVLKGVRYSRLIRVLVIVVVIIIVVAGDGELLKALWDWYRTFF